jgi:recombination protein RecA
VDKALGIGGLPCGKITELMTPGTSPIGDGPTCISAKIAAKVQRQQEIVSIIDMNHSFDPWQAERCGLIAPQLLLARPDTILAALTTLESAARNTRLIVVVMGVVTGLLQHVEPDSLITLLKRLESIVRQSGSVFLFVTTPHKGDPFSPQNYPAGFPLADIADIRLWVQDENWTHDGGLVTAYKANVTVIKNELAVVGKGANIRLKLTSA